MKTILTMLTGCLILTGCYTQFNAGSSSSGTRTPDFSKVETQVDESTKVTDYYDNSSYSWYLRNFNYGFGSRYYDRYGYDPVYDYYGTYNTWGWGNRGYFDMNPYGYGYGYGYDYDYIDYRIRLWHMNNLHYYNDWGFYNQPVVYYYYPSDGNTGQAPSTPRRRSSRENVLIGANSTQSNMPVNVSSSGISSGSYKSNTLSNESLNGRKSRSQVTESPAVMQPAQGSTGVSTSVSTQTSTGSTGQSESTIQSGRRNTREQVRPPAQQPPAQQQPPKEETRQPETKQAPPAKSDPAPAPTRARSSRTRNN
ncbi:MAG: hypothetical protein J0L62_12600 [Bacteroidetes bacterium]|nr:hypothetical protein [Bacteroidota bacterium]